MRRAALLDAVTLSWCWALLSVRLVANCRGRGRRRLPPALTRRRHKRPAGRDGAMAMFSTGLSWSPESGRWRTAAGMASVCANVVLPVTHRDADGVRAQDVALQCRVSHAETRGALQGTSQTRATTNQLLLAGTAARLQWCGVGAHTGSPTGPATLAAPPSSPGESLTHWSGYAHPSAVASPA